jgi:hypothetical protein
VLLAAGAATAFLLAPLRRSRGSGAARESALPELRSERQALYASIRDLDHDFETGKISEDDYRTMREELRSRAVALLREERSRGEVDASTPAPVAASGGAAAAASACPACGAPPEAGWSFCAKCGARLGAPAP